MYKIKEGLWVHKENGVPFFYLPSGRYLRILKTLGYKRGSVRHRHDASLELKFLLPLEFLLENPNKLY